MKLQLFLVALGAAGALAAPIDSDGVAGVAGVGTRSDLSLAVPVPLEARILGFQSFKNWWRDEKPSKDEDKKAYKKKEEAAEEVSDDPPDDVEDEVEKVEKAVEKNKDNPGWMKKQIQKLQPFAQKTWTGAKSLGSSIASSSALGEAVATALATASATMIGGMTGKKIDKLNSKERETWSSNFVKTFLEAVPDLTKGGVKTISNTIVGDGRKTGLLNSAMSAIRPVKTTK